MHDIQLPAAAERTTEQGLRELGRDLRFLDGTADPQVHRRSVARRLVEAGASPEVLDVVLPGWQRYLRPGTAA